MCHGKGISALPRRRLWDDLPRVMPGDTTLPPNIFDPRRNNDPTPRDLDPDPRDRGRPNDPRNPGFPGDPRNPGVPGDPRNPGRPNDPRVPGPPTTISLDPRRSGEPEPRTSTDPRTNGAPNPPTTTVSLDPRVHGAAPNLAAAPVLQMGLGPALKYLSSRSPTLADALRPTA